MINPLTGMDDQQDPGAIMPNILPTMPNTQGLTDPNMPMAPGSGGGAEMPAELSQAQQVLQQADAVLGPSQTSQPAPGAPQPGPPPLSGLMSGSPAQKRAGIQQQQVAGLEQMRSLDQQQGALDERAAAARSGLAATNYAAENLRSVNVDRQVDEREQQQNIYAGKLAQARKESDAAVTTWMNAKPTHWWKDSSDGEQVARSFLIGLAYAADDLNAMRGAPKQGIGQQAVQLVNQLIDRHHAEEVARIEKLHQEAVKKTNDVDRLTRERADAISRIEDKYAGIEKKLEAEARAQRAQLGLTQAAVDSDQVVVNHKQRALEAEQRRLDALNGFVDRETALEISSRRRAGAGGGKGGKYGPFDPDDPYAGMTVNQRDIAMRKDAALAIPNLDGSHAGKAKTPQEATKIRKGQEATASFIDNLHRMSDFIKREGTIAVPVFESGVRREREALTTALAGNLTIMNETGILQQGEYARYARVLQPGAFEKNASAATLLDQLAQKAAEDYARKVRSQGVVGEKPAEQGPTQPETMPAMRPQGTSRMAAQDIEAMQWARSHPGDPRATQILDRLRLQYGNAGGL